MFIRSGISAKSILNLTLLAVMVQAFVPAGLMPQASSNGWILKICPDGLPVSVMEALFGPEHHHHHHHQSDQEAVETYQPCDLGGGLLAEFVTQSEFGLPALHNSTRFEVQAVSSTVVRPLRFYNSRAPPGAQKNQPSLV